MKHGYDLDIGVYFPGDPEPGRSVTITDEGQLDVALSGGVEEPKDVYWDSGTVQLLFTGITESPGSSDMGVCGDIYAELIGLWLPPGATQQAEVPVSFKGKFRAVMKTSRPTTNIDSLIKMIPEQ